jgi:hypothetical protein
MTPEGVSAGGVTLSFGRFAPLMAAPSCVTAATPATSTGGVSMLPAASQVMRAEGLTGTGMWCCMHFLMRGCPPYAERQSHACFGQCIYAAGNNWQPLMLHMC